MTFRLRCYLLPAESVKTTLSLRIHQHFNSLLSYLIKIISAFYSPRHCPFNSFTALVTYQKAVVPMSSFITASSVHSSNPNQFCLHLLQSSISPAPTVQTARYGVQMLIISLVFFLYFENHTFIMLMLT